MPGEVINFTSFLIVNIQKACLYVTNVPPFKRFKSFQALLSDFN